MRKPVPRLIRSTNSTSTRIAPLHLFGVDASFTNASLFMVIVLAAITFVMVIGTSGSHIVPNRLQITAELSYEFVASMVRQTAGDAGMRFFPFVFSVFMFVFFSNLIGLIPYTFTVTSQIIVTFAFAAFIILLVILYGFYKNGMHFLNLFIPSGVHRGAAALHHADRSLFLLCRARFRSRFVFSATCWPATSR